MSWHSRIQRDELNNRRAREIARFLRAAGHEATVVPIAQALAVVDFFDDVIGKKRRIRSEKDWDTFLEEDREAARKLTQ